MDEPHQFICIDCGYEVFWYGVKPSEDRCATCAWIAKIEDPIEKEKLRKFLKDDEVSDGREETSL